MRYCFQHFFVDSIWVQKLLDRLLQLLMSPQNDFISKKRVALDQVCIYFDILPYIHFFYMGNNQGVVWNDSDFPIQYCIYGAFEELGCVRKRRTINPHLDLNISQGAINLDGFQSIRQNQVNPKYAQSFVEVQPGRHTSVGLTQLKMNEHKISIRVKIGDYVKYLVKDVVIKSEKDFRLKIRYDLSIKNLGVDQASDLLEENEERSELRKERQMRQEKIYAQTLQQLVSVLQ